MRSEKNLVIIGCGETALLAYEYFTFDSEYNVVAFAANLDYIVTETMLGLPVVDLGGLEKFYPAENCFVFVAIGAARLNRDRTGIYRSLLDKGYVFASYISSKAFVWNNVQIGDNCFILEGNTLQPFVQIGNNVTLWSGNHIGHRSRILDNCFISSHCVISGFCIVGEYSFLGVNCTLEDHVTIASNNFIGANVLIQKQTQDSQIFQDKQPIPSKVSAERFFRVNQ